MIRVAAIGLIIGVAAVHWGLPWYVWVPLSVLTGGLSPVRIDKRR